MEIGGRDIAFKYAGDEDQFIRDTLAVCRRHWPQMVVEFDNSNTFYVHNDRESFLYWEGKTEVRWWENDDDVDDVEMICFIYNHDVVTMVMDEGWEEGSVALIVADMKKLGERPQSVADCTLVS